jgi:hypothetical protein
MHPQWARDIRDQCQAAGVAFFFKQWGEWHPTSTWPIVSAGRDCPAGAIEFNAPDTAFAGYGRSLTTLKKVGKKAAGRLLDGAEHSAFPDRASP